MDFMKIPSFNLSESSVKITLLKPEQERREKQVEILRTSSVRPTRSDPQSSQGSQTQVIAGTLPGSATLPTRNNTKLFLYQNFIPRIM